MTITLRLIISLVVAAVVSAAFSYISTGAIMPAPLLFGAFCVATIATALLSSAQGGTTTAPAQGQQQSRESRAPQGEKPVADGPREQGKVKWFNVSKGFGFIVKDDGEEIFVHFRSIRGEGRRSLRDGQRVSFVVAQSDKGPQAEDVEAL